MKKLIIILVILGFAAAADADLIFLIGPPGSNMSEYSPQPDEIYLNPSDTIGFGMALSAGEDMLCFQIMFELNNEQAEFLINENDPFEPHEPYIIWDNTFLIMPPSNWNNWDDVGICSWVEAKADNVIASVPGPLDIFHDVRIHCLGTEDVVLTVTVSGATVIDGESFSGKLS